MPLPVFLCGFHGDGIVVVVVVSMAIAVVLRSHQDSIETTFRLATKHSKIFVVVVFPT